MNPKLSQLAETLIGSEIVVLAAAVKEKMKAGEKVYNFTIGDFDPKIFPIPAVLEAEIHEAYKERYTNYPASEGELDLRQAVGDFVRRKEGLDYSNNEILIAAGGRPLIYTVFRSIVDKGDKVIYAVPSWNNNHYVHFTEGVHCVLEAKKEHNFMPVAADIKPHLEGATLLALCSPQNPTGTAFGKEALQEICDMVAAENKRRKPEEKKLYILFDQMYWTLTYGETQHHNPVSLCPELKDYTIFVDGASKAFAGTGIRVGWSMGPAAVIGKMKAVLSHVGAWAPMAEQKATAKFLAQPEAVDSFLEEFKVEIEARLSKIYEGFHDLKVQGFPVDAIAPQAAIYLTIKIDLVGKTTAAGVLLNDQASVTNYILEEAKLAIVPFALFGADKASPWYRLSIGTCKKEEIPTFLGLLKDALSKLK